MKKIMLLSVCLLALAACLLAFGSCTEHTHTGEKWGRDVTHHWHVCDTCNSAFDTAEHNYEDSMVGTEIVKTCTECGYSYVAKNVPEHEHVYADVYAHNEAFHYKTCTFEDCIMQSEKAEHIYGTPEIVQETGKITKTYLCQVCEYQRQEVITVDTVIKDDSAWNLAFENLELKNFQMKVFLPEHTNQCIITEDGAFVQYGSGWRVVYTKKNASGSFDLYIKEDASAGAEWKYYVDANGDFYNAFCREAILEINYAENFDQFVYNEETGEYTCPTDVECTAYDISGAIYPKKMFCYNNTVKVADGKISHIECDYYFEGESNRSSFVYYNIGIAEFEIPESVISSAVPMGDYSGQ